MIRYINKNSTLLKQYMLSRTAENYLRVIYELYEKKGYALSKEIAKNMCVKAPTVSEMTKKLAAAGLVVYNKNGPIILSAEGKQKGEAIKKRYEVFLKLFTIAGVEQKTAYMDACYLEHHLSEETVSKLVAFVDKLQKNS